MISEKAKSLIGEDEYNSWLNEDAEKFSRQAGVLESALRNKQERLLEGASE